MRRENLGDKDQKSAVDDFAVSVPTNGVALVYYIGLGAHLERQGKLYNLLRPVDTSIENENDYRSLGLSVTDMIKTLRTKSGARMGLIFLDASWASPIKPATNAVRSGLRGFELDADSMVMFAAGTSPALASRRASTTRVTAVVRTA